MRNIFSIHKTIHKALCLSLTVCLAFSSPFGHTAKAESLARSSSIVQEDPGHERLTGSYLPAAEENISLETTGTEATSSQDSSIKNNNSGNISGLNYAPAGLSNLKSYWSETSPYNNKKYTHASDFDGMTVYHGIDVSYHQGNIDFNRVKAAGISYVILRLGYRGYSTGSIVTDSKFRTYIQDAAAAGLPIGVYFWTEAISTEEAVEEANYVINVLEPYRQYIKMPVIIDWELNSNSRHSGLSKSLNTQICSSFCDTVSASGYIPMIYANINDLNNHMDGMALGEQYNIWVARYNNIVNNETVQFYGKYCMWQYDSTGSVDGIAGNVDMNFWYTLSSPDAPVFAHGANGTTSGAAVTTTPVPTAAPTAAPEDEDNDIDDLNDVTDLISTSASKKITLSWKKVTDADGYQITRKDTYDGSYQKIATIEGGDTTSWKNTGLAKKHEYYYKVRAYHKNSDETIYSEYTSITAATKTNTKSGITKKTLILYKKPISGSARLMSVPKGIPLEYVGVTHRSNGSTFHHFRYYTPSKVYDAYRSDKKGLTYYTQGSTTTRLNFRVTAGTSGKLITSIAKHTALPLLGTKRVNGAIWYRTCYSTKKNSAVTGYVSGNYIRR